MRYALALYELAEAAREPDRIAADLTKLSAMIEGSPDLARLLRSPLLSRQDLGRAIAALAEAAGLLPLTRRFLGLLARNRRLFALPAIIAAYRRHFAAKRGEVTAEIRAARPLSPAQREALAAAIRRIAGAKVEIDIAVDPALIGGFVVKLGSRLIDASIRTKLSKLQFAMKGIG